MTTIYVAGLAATGDAGHIPSPYASPMWATNSQGQ
jgi:hypothetical protein